MNDPRKGSDSVILLQSTSTEELRQSEGGVGAFYSESMFRKSKNSCPYSED